MKPDRHEPECSARPEQRDLRLSDAPEAVLKDQTNAEWYRLLLADLKVLVETEKRSLLRIKHQMGLRILATRKELMDKGVVKDQRGWTGFLGDLMSRLSMDLGYSLGELYDALKFVEKYPRWSDFAEGEFEVKSEREGVSATKRISGAEMSWNQVKREVLYPPLGGPVPVQTQRAKITCIFKSELCHGDTEQVEICGYHFGDFVVWQNQKKVKMQVRRTAD